MFILPLTLRECCLVVLYESVIALALILIDGTVAHLLKAAYIYLLGLYMFTNSNCFVLPVLGKLPVRLREGSIILMSQHHSALHHSVNNKHKDHTGASTQTHTACRIIIHDSMFYL